MKRGETGRLLVVDDEIDVMTSLCNILSEVGYDVVGFTRGHDALETLQKQPFDVLLADFDMPEMNGLELLQKALGRDRYLLGFIITGKGTVQTAIKALGLGAFDVIAKPFTLEVLRMKITRALEVRHLRKGEDLLRCVFENSPEGIYLTTAGDRCIMANNAMARIFGYDHPGQLVSDQAGFPFYVYPERRETLLRLLQKREVIFGFESLVFQKSGSPLWISEDIQTVRDTKGNLLYYRGTVRDISSRKRQEETLHESERSLRVWAGRAERSKEICFDVIEDISRDYENLATDISRFLAALSHAVDGRNPWTEGHSERVAEYSVKIAYEMGLDEAEVKNIRLAALCHDIGRIRFDDFLLGKPSRLTEEEFKTIKQHPVQGAALLERIGDFGDVLPLVMYHHERADGQGYPKGLRNDEIPTGAKIIHVAESFEAMTTDRPYRPAPGREYALSELNKCSGTQFDPHIVEAAIKALAI